MTLEYGHGIFYARMWFISLRAEGLDWLAGLFQKPGERWKLVYRFRYDAVPGGEPEHRNWFEVTLRPGMTAEDCLSELRPMIDILTEAMQGERHELVLNTADAGRHLRSPRARELVSHQSAGGTSAMKAPNENAE
jgi:hypothetical protein